MRRRLRTVLIYAAAVAVLLAFLAPIAWVVQISFKTRAQIFVWPPTIFAFAPTLENYRGLFAPGSHFARTLGNSLVAALAATALALAVALPAAYALVGARLRGAGTVRWGIMLFRMMPPVALLLPYYLMARQTGLLGSLGSIAIAHFAFSLAVTAWMMRDAFEAIPTEIEEAARIDGCTHWQVFARIALPLTRASIAASSIFALLTSWNEFLFAVALSRPDTQTVPVAVSAFVGDIYVSWGQLAAATVIGVLPALALAFVGQRWLLAGMAPGAFK
jgi:multiple sugar transport system permease protein